MTFRITAPGIFLDVPTAEEEWRPVVGHPDYEVSNFGRVRSLDRVKVYQRRDQYSGALLTITRCHKGKVLRPGTMTSGHQFVVLGRKKGFCVHVLVLTAFVGPAPDGMECCHWDDDPANNHRDNLRWGTRADNLADYERNYGRPQLLRDGL
jgi:hypothetical protein